MIVLELQVNISLLDEKNGGKYTPVFPGTGCSMQFEDGNTWHCLQEFTDREFAYSGETYKAHITFLEDEPALELCYKGKDFKLLEGQTEICSGIILAAHFKENDLD